MHIHSYVPMFKYVSQPADSTFWCRWKCPFLSRAVQNYQHCKLSPNENPRQSLWADVNKSNFETSGYGE